MIGSLIGDIVGEMYEFTHTKEIPEYLMYQESTFTDDSVCTLAIADSIMNNKPITQTLQKLCRRYPNVGYGYMFSRWITNANPQPYNSYGNGAVMRISSLPYLCKDFKQMLIIGKEVTEITHNHPESFKAVELYLTLMYNALYENVTKDQLRNVAESIYPEIKTFDLEDLHKNYEFNETCQGSFPQALFSFFISDSYEECLKAALYIGGDCDTTACIAGGLAEAFYKVIPQYLIDGMYEKFRLCPDLLSIIKQFNEVKQCQ